MNFAKNSLDPKKIQSIFEDISMRAIDQEESQKLIDELKELFESYGGEKFMSNRYVRFDSFTQQVVINFSFMAIEFSYTLEELMYKQTSI